MATLAEALAQAGQRRQARQQSGGDLSSLAMQVGNVGLSGLSAVGNLSDIPSSMVRDVAAGQNPLDQLLTPFSPDNRVGGRDLNRLAGLAGEEDTWANFWGGLGTEILLDPLTYFTFGGSALTKVGKIAGKAGLLRKLPSIAGDILGKPVGQRGALLGTDLAGLYRGAGRQGQEALQSVLGREGLELAGPRAYRQLGEEAAEAALQRDLAAIAGRYGDETLGSGLGFKVPFGPVMEIPGTRPFARAAGGAIDTGWGWLANSPVGRGVGGLFNYANRGFFGPDEQAIARAATQETEDLLPGVLVESIDWRKQLNQLSQDLAKQYPEELDRIAELELADELAAYSDPRLTDPRYTNEKLPTYRAPPVQRTTGEQAARTASELVRFVEETSLNPAIDSMAEAERRMLRGQLELPPELRRVVQRLGGSATDLIRRHYELFDEAAGRAEMLGAKAVERRMQLPLEPVEGPQRQRVADLATQAFGNEAADAMPLLDAHAYLWSEVTGKKADEWFERFSDINRAASPSDVRPGVGQLVQWTSQGADQFPEPKRISRTGQGPDGREYAFFDDTPTAVPLDELRVAGGDVMQQGLMDEARQRIRFREAFRDSLLDEVIAEAGQGTKSGQIADPAGWRESMTTAFDLDPIQFMNRLTSVLKKNGAARGLQFDDYLDPRQIERVLSARQGPGPVDSTLTGVESMALNNLRRAIDTSAEEAQREAVAAFELLTADNPWGQIGVLRDYPQIVDRDLMLREAVEIISERDIARAAEAGTDIDWRPTEMTPEDFYADAGGYTPPAIQERIRRRIEDRIGPSDTLYQSERPRISKEQFDDIYADEVIRAMVEEAHPDSEIVREMNWNLANKTIQGDQVEYMRSWLKDLWQRDPYEFLDNVNDALNLRIQGDEALDHIRYADLDELADYLDVLADQENLYMSPDYRGTEADARRVLRANSKRLREGVTDKNLIRNAMAAYMEHTGSDVPDEIFKFDKLFDDILDHLEAAENTRNLEQIGDTAIDWRPEEMVPEDFYAGSGFGVGEVTPSIRSRVGQRVQESVEALQRGLDAEDDLLRQVVDRDPKAQVAFGQDGRSVITAFQNADISSFIHEVAHVFRRSLNEIDDEVISQGGKVRLLEQARKALPVAGDEWTREAEEAFATGFERYMRDGRAPSPQLKTVFEKFKDWLTRIYRNLVGTPLEDEVSPELRDVFDRMLGAGRRGEGRSIQHVPRRPSRPRMSSDPQRFARPREFQTYADNARARSPEIREVPTDVVTEVLFDPAQDDYMHILDNYWDYLDSGWPNTELPGGWQAGGKMGHAAALSKWAKSHLGVRLHDQLLGADVEGYLTGMARARANMESIYRQLTVPGAFDANGKPLRQVFSEAGMVPEKAMQQMARRTGQSLEDLEQLAVRPELAKSINTTMRFQELPEWQQMIHDNFDWITQFWKSSVTALGGFPSFQSRNLISGQHMNAVASGEIENPADLAAYTFDYMLRGRDLLKKVRGKGELTPDEEHLVRMIEAHGVVSRTQSEDVFGITHEHLEATPYFEEYFTGKPYKEARKWAQEKARREPLTEKFGAMGRRLEGPRELWNTIQRLGSNTNQAVEWANRVPMFLYLMERKGYTPAAAAQKVVELQFDYGRLAPFEKAVMKNLFPFYTFSRNAAPAIWKTLVQRPGGGLAQTIRGYNYATRETPETAVRPDYLGNQFSAYVGPSPDGRGARFIASGGLAFEDPLSFVPGSGGLRGTGYEALSRLHPALQFPLEMVTNQSFFKGGQPLTSLDPPIGRTISNIGEQVGLREPDRGPVTRIPVPFTEMQVPIPTMLERVAAAGPTSRFLSRARTLTDPRKDLFTAPWNWTVGGAGAQLANQLTGFRVTDVNPEQQLRQLGQTVERRLEDMGGREYKRAYISKRMLERLSPAEQAAARELSTLYLKVQRARKRERDQQERSNAGLFQ